MLKIRIIPAICLILLYSSQAFALKVVASFLPVYVFAKNVAGDRAEVDILVPPGAEVHEFSLRPSDRRKLDKADIILLSGAGLEANLLRGNYPNAVDTSRGMELIKIGGFTDPHVWLDPLQAVRQVENIRDALSAKDPKNGEYYKKRAAEYSARLLSLHSEIERAIASLKTRHLVTYHEAFNYFARRYGLTPHSLTGPGAEQPLPARMTAAYDIVKKERIKAVFREEQFSAGPLERLKADLGVKICTLSTLESGKPEPDIYEKAMRANLKSIAGCLGGK